MADIQKDFNSMGLPMNITRGNPIPVDSTELWYSLTQAQEYAKNGATAYVGQTIKVLDEETQKVKEYVIQFDGSLVENENSIVVELEGISSEKQLNTYTDINKTYVFYATPPLTDSLGIGGGILCILNNYFNYQILKPISFGSAKVFRRAYIEHSDSWTDFEEFTALSKDAMIFKGTVGTEGSTLVSLPTTYKTGWTYRVNASGIYAGQKCEVGDLIIALIDRNSSDNLDSDWTVAQSNINTQDFVLQGAILVNGDCFKEVSDPTQLDRGYLQSIPRVTHINDYANRYIFPTLKEVSNKLTKLDADEEDINNFVVVTGKDGSIGHCNAHLAFTISESDSEIPSSGAVVRYINEIVPTGSSIVNLGSISSVEQLNDCIDSSKTYLFYAVSPLSSGLGINAGTLCVSNMYIDCQIVKTINEVVGGKNLNKVFYRYTNISLGIWDNFVDITIPSNVPTYEIGTFTGYTAEYDASSTMSGSYTLMGNMCFVTATATIKEGWGDINYNLPVAALENTACLSTDGTNSYRISTDINSSYLYIHRVESGALQSEGTVSFTLIYKYK